MKVTFVSPRYGIEVGGGAEGATRALAEQLVARRGFDVEVLTTTAIDTMWRDGFAPGDVEVEGVRVRRFGVDQARAADFEARSARLLPAPRRATATDEREWLSAQGPVSHQLVAAIGESDADVIALGPYLYHPIVAGVAAARVPTILHGAAHDEPALALAMFADLYRAVDGLAFWSSAERSLVLDRFPVAATPQAIIGLGVDPQPADAEHARQLLGLGAAPYLLCLGRVDDLKGSALLARLFAEYCARHEGDLQLVFAGPVVADLPVHPRVVIAGSVSDATKWGLLAGAAALVSPSALESFGIVLFESWSVGRPVLVNARCAPTAAHTREANGGLTFSDFAEFEAAIARLSVDVPAADALGASGRAYTEREFGWESVLDRYCRLLDRTIAHAAARHAVA